VTARRRILELPETAQTLVGTGEIPAAGIDTLLDWSSSGAGVQCQPTRVLLPT
jgi:hypothetical protein